MKKFMKRALLVIVGLLFIGTFVYLFISSRDKRPEYEIVVPQADAVISKSTLLTGTIEPRDEIEIKPQISGIISEIYVEAGQQIKEGDIIAKIKVIAEESQLSAAHNRVSVAENAIALQKAKTARTMELYEKKFASREEYEEALTALKSAEIELAAARDALTIVRDGVSSTNAKGSNTLVRSTITGLVLDVPVKVGSSVIQSNTFNDGTTIAKVADMNDLIFKGKVDETEVGLLSPGQPMTITVGALEDISAETTIEYISPKAESNNGTNTFEIKAAANLPGVKTLRAGYSANAAVVLREVRNVLAVPEAIVEFEGDDAYVYVLTDESKQTFERQKVETGMSDGINIEITGGISADTKLRGGLKQ